MSESTLRFDGGTLVFDGAPEACAGALAASEFFRLDPRVGLPRAPAHLYRRIVAQLTRAGLPFVDAARRYNELVLQHQAERRPYPHQLAAITAWQEAGRRGVVVLPTGAGKTYVAELAIARTARSALVVAPTIDLMNQWSDRLAVAFGSDPGLVGGGAHEVRELTVTTYDSAYRYLDRLGDRFGLLVFDEVHHLPGPSYLAAAMCAIAPFRLGLTATLERADGRESELSDVVGPVVYRQEILDLAGDVLAPYETVRISVDLTADEAETYRIARGTYIDFVRSQSLRMGDPSAWGRFIVASSRSRAGRRALLAYRRQREVAFGCEAKQRVLSRLLRQHRADRMLVFIDDNESVYRIARAHLLPAITHETDPRERRVMLRAFHAGEVRALVTSRVLNEGVDVPAANVAVVLSGSASIREHVQRLGRILRREPNKEAVLYEVVARGTTEEDVSQRRREHAAYGAGAC